MTLDTQPHPRLPEGFVAACAVCGAPLHIVLGEAMAQCRHCQTAEPLDEPTRSRLAEATHRIEKVTFFEHQRRVRRARETETVLVLGGISMVATWFVLGGGAYVVCRSLLPDGVGTLEVLRSATLGSESPSIAWTLFSLVVGFGISLGWVLIAFARARTAGAPPRALPPLAGGVPRCRLCGAGLSDPGVVRACRHCSARNLVDGRALDEQVDDVLGQLRLLEQTEAAVIASANEIVESTAMWSALVALFGPLLAALVGALTQSWDPRSFSYAWLAYVPAGIAAVVIVFQSPSRVRSFVEARPGDLVRVGGESHHVHAVLRDMYPFIGCQTLHCVGPVGAPHPTLALEVTDYPDFHVRAFRIEPGGAPLAAADVAQLGALPVEALPSGTSDGRGQAMALPKESPLRMFAAHPAPGVPPTWTLHPSVEGIQHVFVP